MGGLRRQKQDAIIVDPATRGKLALVQAANSRLRYSWLTDTEYSNVNKYKYIQCDYIEIRFTICSLIHLENNVLMISR